MPILLLAGVTGVGLFARDGAVSLEALRRHTEFLGHDGLEDRAAGTAGALAAARDIAGDLQKAGLEPLGPDDRWFQEVPLHGLGEADTELALFSECDSSSLVGGQPPTPASVRNSSYPLARYLYLHSVRRPRGWPARFLDFVFSDEGRRIVEEVGFVSLWETIPSTE